jgi:MEMO1 family protein
MVGGISSDKEKMYGEILAKYFTRPDVLFVISSDFCHWGELNIIYYKN